MKQGMVFPRMSSNREMGATINCSIVPISFSLTMTELVKTVDIARIISTTTPGTKNSLEFRLGLNQAREESANCGVINLGLVESNRSPCMELILERRMSAENLLIID